METEHLVPTLALSFLPGMTARLFKLLIEVFETPVSILAADPAMLVRAGLRAETVDGLRDYQKPGKNGRLHRRIEQALAWEREPDHHILTLEGRYYPPLLRAIPDPPPLLYGLGRIEVLQRPQLAMVGSRNPSAGGRRIARKFAGEISALGYTVTSGLALGIDRESHLGALDGGHETVAVLGTGVDRIYPAGNQGLAVRIAGQGALVSEFPLGVGARPWHFPQRNRIISGLSLGVVVVEAAEKSGSLITAGCAAEQGRDVFAVPGAIDNPGIKGCHALIRQGALLVDSAAHIVNELAPLRGVVADESRPFPCSGAPDDFNEAEQRILSEIGYDGVDTDILVLATGLGISEIMAALVRLEMKGKIHNSARGYTLGRG